MQKSLLTLAAAAVGLLAAGAARAEPLASYDKFNTLATLDGDLWMENEISRLVLNKQMVLGLGVAGNTDADKGLHHKSQSLTLRASDLVTAMAADVRVDTVEVPACEANRAVGYTWLRMGGAFFNVGSPLRASGEGDVVAWVTVSRDSNSTDAEGVLSVTGSVNQCRNASCMGHDTLGSVDLGKVQVGSKERYMLSLDRSTKTFVFQRGLKGEPLSVTYSVSDSAAPGRVEKTFSMHSAAPNCAGEVLMSKLVTRIDNVAVNASALP